MSLLPASTAQPNAILVSSGDQLGYPLTSTPLVNVVSPLPSTLTACRLPAATYTMRVPSGDHDWPSCAGAAGIGRPDTPDPSAFMTQTTVAAGAPAQVFPPLGENASRVPLGAQAGCSPTTGNPRKSLPSARTTPNWRAPANAIRPTAAQLELKATSVALPSVTSTVIGFIGVSAQWWGASRLTTWEPAPSGWKTTALVSPMSIDTSLSTLTE